MTDTFDVIVIGAGPAGEVAAGRLGEEGLSVCIAEEHLVGGECSFYACMPSKALLRPGEALAEARRIPGAADAITGRIDPDSVFSRRDEIIHNLDDSGMLPWLEQRNVKLIRGHAELTAMKKVKIGDRDLTAKQGVILATGSTALLPAQISGLAEIVAWTNREATTAKKPPSSLIILGGGPVGVELAQAWQTLGSDVILIEGERRLLPREEIFACELVTDALDDLGIDIRTGRKAAKVRRQGDQIVVELDDDETVSAKELLVAVGREPRVADIGLRNLGLSEDKPPQVDQFMRVPDHPWLYAVGDVNGLAPLTHMGKYQARIAADHLTGKETRRRENAHGPLSPRVTFTDPQVAAVGHTEKSARDAGITPRIVTTETSGNAGGSFYGRGAPGQVKFVIDDERNQLIGATITGSEVTEFLHAATIAVGCEISLEDLWHAVPAFPTRSEIWLSLVE